MINAVPMRRRCVVLLWFIWALQIPSRYFVCQTVLWPGGPYRVRPRNCEFSLNLGLTCALAFSNKDPLPRLKFVTTFPLEVVVPPRSERWILHYRMMKYSMKAHPVRLLTACAVSTALAVGSVQGATPEITDPALTSIGIIAGGDEGEGLDLDGNFLYALAIGGNPGESFQVRDALFQGLINAEVSGASLSAGNRILKLVQPLTTANPKRMTIWRRRRAAFAGATPARQYRKWC
jgi:hypothetical protein